MKDIFEELGLKEHNIGSCAGTRWCSGKGTVFSSINPSDETILGEIVSATSDDYDAITQAASCGFLRWREVPAPVRGECIRQIGLELRRYKDALGSLISLECGKIKQEGDGEVQEMIDMADFAVGLSRMLYGKTIPSERKSHQMLEQWHPLGPVGVITAFNFPMAVWAWNAFLAAICGDTIVWKPSEKVALCAIAVQHICNRVMSRLGYDGVLSLLVTHEPTLSERLVADSRFPLISFTGSTKVGRHVAQQVAGRLGRHILELSGNNAVIVDKTADLQLAVPSILFGSVGTAGQRCTSTRRVIVHRSRYDELVQQLKAAYGAVHIGEPLSPMTLMGPLIDQQAVTTFLHAIERAKSAGAELLYGGDKIDRPGYFVQPTLMRATADLAIIQEETFGPLTYIITFDHFSEAITIHNNVSQGLSSSLFTENFRNAHYFISYLGSDCGIANINLGTSGAEIGGAFGGEKDTGGGREAGSDSWKLYMRQQTNTINWGHELPLAQGIVFGSTTKVSQ